MSLPKSEFLDPPPPYVTQKTIDDVNLNNSCHSSYQLPSDILFAWPLNGRTVLVGRAEGIIQSKVQ